MKYRCKYRKTKCLKWGFLSVILFLFGINVRSETDSLAIFHKEINQFSDAMAYQSLKTRIKAEAYVMKHVPVENKSAAVTQLYIQPLNVGLLEQDETITEYELGRAYEYAGGRSLLTGAYDAAEENFKKSLDLLKLSGEDYRIHRWLGILYATTQQTDLGIESYLEGIESVKRKHSESSAEGQKLLLVFHSNLLSIVLKKGDFKAAKAYGNLVTKYAKAVNHPYYDAISNINMATIQVSSNDPYSAINSLRASESHIDKFKNLTLNYYNLYGMAFYQIEDFDSAKKYIQKSIEATPANSTNLTNILVNRAAIANIDYLTGNYQASLDEYTEILDTYKTYPDRFTQYLADSYNKRSKVYLALDQVDLAYDDIKSALSQREDYKTWKIQYYAGLTAVYASYYEQTKNDLYLDSIAWNIDRTENYIDSLRVEHRYLEGEDGLNEILYDVCALNLESLHKVYQIDDQQVNLDDVFNFFEKIKTYSLREYLKTDDAVKKGMLPIEIVTEEKKLKQAISELMTQSKLNVQQLKKDTSTVNFEDQINNLQNDYTAFLKQVEQDYPNYYKFQNQSYESSLSAVQSALDDQEALIEYYLATDAVYILTIQKNSCLFHKIDVDQKWKAKLIEFLETLYAPAIDRAASFDTSNRDQFLLHARNFYKDLLEVALENLNSDVSRVKIIADNQLKFLPFGLLLSTDVEPNASYRSLPYVLKDYSLSYDDSASDYVASISQERSSQKYNYVGFMPNYDEKEEALPYAIQSVKQASALFNGKTFSSDSQSDINLNKAISKSNILHLTMHGEVDLLNPSLSHLRFSSNMEDNLYLSDIYSKSVDASLVVLSACNTGTGKYINGDGIQNISRAFRFAGASSTLMSLWTLPDVQTAQLESRFFENVKAGKHIDASLRLAKLSFLENAPNAFVHPFYWAGFIPTGNMHPLDSSNNQPQTPFLILLGLIILAVLTFILKK